MMQTPNNHRTRIIAAGVLLALGCVAVAPLRTAAQEAKDKEAPGKSSYDQISPVLLGQESFAAQMAKDKADKPAVMARQQKLLEERYDLTARPDTKLKMTRGKPIQVGPTTRLPVGMTWEKLAEMTPEQIRERDLFPKGFLPLPHPKRDAGGMLFPQMEIKQLARVEPTSTATTSRLRPRASTRWSTAARCISCRKSSNCSIFRRRRAWASTAS
jgi:hypothetical protein